MDSLLSVWSVLDLVSINKGDFYETYTFENSVIKDKLGNENYYDRWNPPNDGAIEIIPLFFIDHIEVVDEYEQVMILHGGLRFLWQDNRIRWNVTQYGGVKQITRTIGNLRAMGSQPFLPKIHATEMYSKTNDLLQSNGASLTLTQNGFVHAKVRVKIRSTCNFAYNSWPYDRQNCSFSLYSPSSINKVSFAHFSFYDKSKLKFNPISGLPAVHDVQDFKLDIVDRERIFLLPGSKIVSAETVLTFPNSYKKLIRSVYRFNLSFIRSNKYYTAHMAIPMLFLCLITYFLFCLKTLNGAIFLLLMVMIQSLNAIYLRNSLPPDYMSTPSIAKVATFLFLKTMVFFFWRLFTLYHRNTKGKTTPLQKTLYYGEISLKVLLPFFSLLDYHMLFHI